MGNSDSGKGNHLPAVSATMNCVSATMNCVSATMNCVSATIHDDERSDARGP